MGGTRGGVEAGRRSLEGKEGQAIRIGPRRGGPIPYSLSHCRIPAVLAGMESDGHVLMHICDNTNPPRLSTGGEPREAVGRKPTHSK